MQIFIWSSGCKYGACGKLCNHQLAFPWGWRWEGEGGGGEELFAGSGGQCSKMTRR